MLEERRHNVLTDALAKSDRGALFTIANDFHVRHQDAKQKRDYDEFYLDWIFWVYLSTGRADEPCDRRANARKPDERVPAPIASMLATRHSPLPGLRRKTRAGPTS